jgi:UDP-glucose 4-epimerase
VKVCVTGGAGFIGSWVADAYLEDGHEVVIVDNMSTGVLANVPAGARLVEMDVTSQAFDALAEQEAFDVINHHAAHIELRVSVTNPMLDAQANVLGSIRVLEAARRTGVKHVVLASSGGALYGEQEVFPADESHPIRPTSPYGVAKRAMELYGEYYARMHGLLVTSLRYTNVYGPRQNPFGEAGVVAIFLEKCLNDEPCIVNGEGNQKRDYIYVSEVACANLAVTKAKIGGAFNVATGVETDVNGIVDALGRSLGKTLNIQRGPAKAGDLPRNVCTSERLSQATGWKSQLGVEQGIERTVAWFQDRWSSQSAR